MSRRQHLCHFSTLRRVSFTTTHPGPPRSSVKRSSFQENAAFSTVGSQGDGGRAASPVITVIIIILSVKDLMGSDHRSGRPTLADVGGRGGGVVSFLEGVEGE